MRRAAIGFVCCLLAGCAFQIQPHGSLVRILRDERAANNRVAVLAEDLLYCYPRTGDIIIVPVGYATDFASVPGGVDRFLEEYGNSIEAAIIHDWLYAVGESGKKQYADDLFRFALAEQRVNLTDRWLKWFGVVAGGGRSYGRADEWERRFYKPNGEGPMPPPYARRQSAIVTRVDGCEQIDNLERTREIVAKYGSHTWPAAPSTP